MTVLIGPHDELVLRGGRHRWRDIVLLWDAGKAAGSSTGVHGPATILTGKKQVDTFFHIVVHSLKDLLRLLGRGPCDDHKLCDGVV